MSNSMFRILFIVLIVLLLLVSCKEPKHKLLEPVLGNGKITILDKSKDKKGDVGWYPSVVIDTLGNIHVSYCDAYLGDVKYARKEPNGWIMDTVDSDGAVGKYMNMAVGKNNIPQIIYHDQDLHTLKYAILKNKKWEISTLDSAKEVGMGANIILDKDDNPHVFYYNAKSKLYYVRKVEGKWKHKIVDRVAGAYTSVISTQIDDKGIIHIVYVNWNLVDSVFKYAYNKDDKWIIEVVKERGNPGWKNSMLLEKNNSPFLSYITVKNSNLHLAKRENSKWISEFLMPDVNNHKMDRTKGGKLVIAYEYFPRGRMGTGVMRYIRETVKNKWQVVRVDESGPTGSFLSLALKNDGRVVIAYYDAKLKAIKVYEE